MLETLAWTFFKIGVLGFGGGPGSIGVIQQLTEQAGLIKPNVFADQLAIGSALPGPLATKLAASIGYQNAGWLGAGVAVLATLLPSALAMTLLFTWLSAHQDVPLVKGILLAGKPIALAMVALAFLQLLPGSLTTWVPIVLFFATVVLVRFFAVPVVPVIVGGLIVGVLSQYHLLP